jgi:hypothetical protein
MARRIALTVFLATLLGTAVALAASPVHGALYTDHVTLPDYASKLKVVKLRVSSDGERLKYIGPQERCGKPGAPAGFNAIRATIGRIPKVKIANDGSFKAHREYRATYTSPLGGIYYFDWDIHVSGHFATKNKAKGTSTYEMVESDNRGGSHSCGQRKISFTALRQ